MIREIKNLTSQCLVGFLSCILWVHSDHALLLISCLRYDLPHSVNRYDALSFVTELEMPPWLLWTERNRRAIEILSVFHLKVTNRWLQVLDLDY